MWVIDAQTHGGRQEVRRTGGLFSPRVEHPFLGRRDQTALLTGLARQVTAGRTAIDLLDADMPVSGALCFVGTELPCSAPASAGSPFVGRGGRTKLLSHPGPVSAAHRSQPRQAVPPA